MTENHQFVIKPMSIYVGVNKKKSFFNLKMLKMFLRLYKNNFVLYELITYRKY